MTAPAAPWIPDASAIAAFRENPEGFRLKYRLHLVPATPDDKMRAGSAIHAGLNVLRSAGNVEDAVRAARTERGDTEGARNAEHVERIVRAYAARYPREAEPFRVVETERYVEALVQPEGGAPFGYCGIVDSVIEFADDASYVMDTKSTGAYLNAQWTETMALSDQMTGYVALRRALGLRCDGYFVEGIHVTDRVGVKTGVAPVDVLKDFVRVGPIRVEAWRVARWARDMQYTLAQIEALEQERGIDAPWPLYQNWPYGKVDAYRDFYTTPPELHDATMQLFERRTWSPRAVAEGRNVVHTVSRTESA